MTVYLTLKPYKDRPDILQKAEDTVLSIDTLNIGGLGITFIAGSYRKTYLDTGKTSGH